MTTTPRAAAASLLLRGTTCAAFAFAASQPSLPQLRDPATHARMVAWPFGALAVPLLLRLVTRRRSYPWLVDSLLALPFALDAFGNVLGLYGRFASYDTVNHGVSWLGLSLLVSRIPVLRGLPAWAHAWIVVASGAFAAIVWELGEYGAFIHASSYTRAAYTDTLTDLLAGTSGAAAAAALVLVAAYRPQRLLRERVAGLAQPLQVRVDAR
jgi:hypothetical protein